MTGRLKLLRLRPIRLLVVLTSCAVLSPGCSDDDDTTRPLSSEPPRVEDLAVASVTDTSATLTWTVPEHSRAISQYDLRYGPTYLFLDRESWDRAYRVPDVVSSPGAPGTIERVVLTGLRQRTTYYFALRYQDDAGDWSTLSMNLPVSPSADFRWTNDIPGPPAPVVEMIMHQGDLVVAMEGARLARWDGSSWTDLIEGLSGTIQDLAVFRDLLHVAGSFGVLRLTATSTDTLTTMFECVDCGAPIAYSMAVYGERLIVGGKFTSIGDVPARRIAAWDGASWHFLDSAMGEGEVLALTVHDGDLVAGGSFERAGGYESNGVARWDGRSWHAMAPLRRVSSLLVHDGDVMALSSDGIWRSDGSSTWQRITTWGPNTMVAYRGSLVIAGRFRDVGAIPAQGIARWDGRYWDTFGSGVEQEVNALLVIDDHELLVGGNIRSAGGREVVNLATWKDSP